MERKTTHSLQPAKAGSRHRKASCKTPQAGVRSKTSMNIDECFQKDAARMEKALEEKFGPNWRFEISRTADWLRQIKCGKITLPFNMGSSALPKQDEESLYGNMTDNTDIQTVEDALVNIHETVLDPERAAPLIRKNLAQNLENSYIFRFYKKAGKIVCESKVLTSAQPKFLGKIEGLS